MGLSTDPCGKLCISLSKLFFSIQNNYQDMKMFKLYFSKFPHQLDPKFNLCKTISLNISSELTRITSRFRLISKFLNVRT